MRFDRYGRLVAIADAVRDSDGTGGTEPTGNEMRFTYDPAGRLVGIADTLDRDYHLEYDADGRLTKLTRLRRPRGEVRLRHRRPVGERHLPEGHGGGGDLPGRPDHDLHLRDRLRRPGRPAHPARQPGLDHRRPGARLARPDLHRRLRRRSGRRGHPGDLGRRLALDRLRLHGPHRHSDRSPAQPLGLRARRRRSSDEDDRPGGRLDHDGLRR